jgi:outer membrane lipoprotein-sorting protein
MCRLLLVLLLILPLPEAGAQTSEERGYAIALEMQRRDAGWRDMRAQMEMVLRNRQGDESHRLLRTLTLEVEGDGDKGLTIFDTPPDVRGTAFLSFTHPTKADDQWLYLPALKRVKRIASATKSGPFMGSEFAYEDLSSNEVEKYRYKWLHDAALAGRPVHVLERYPVYEHSGYRRQVVWVDTAMLRPVRVEFFDRKNAPLKTLTYHEYRLYLDSYWRADRMEMSNHQTGKSTELIWRDYEFQTGLSERDFDKSTLKRVH